MEEKPVQFDEFLLLLVEENMKEGLGSSPVEIKVLKTAFERLHGRRIEATSAH